MQHPQTTQSNRRQFIRSGAVGTAAAFSYFAGVSSRASEFGPNERVNVAQVGIGGKGNHNRQMLLGSGMCNIVALCDVDLEGERTIWGRVANGDASPPEGEPADRYGTIKHKAPYYNDFRVMLDEMHSQIDAVVISTPDHTHFPVAMAAMALGKHVWVEKPLAHSFGQCERLMKMAKRSGVATQMGNQGHSSANRTQFESLVDADAIGDVRKVVAYMTKGRRWHGWGASVKDYPSEKMPPNLNWDVWTGPAPKNPYSFRLHPANWRSWFEYGCGALGDWAPHILDTCHRYLELGLPTTVNATRRAGANPLVYPQETTLQFQFPARDDKPACDVWWHDGKKNAPDLGDGLESIDTSIPGKVIYGDKRVLQGGSHSSTLQVVAGDTSPLPEYEEDVPNHWQNFLMACRNEAEANSKFERSGPLTQVLSLGMIAQRLGGSIQFDTASHQITNNNDANALLDPAPRAGWEEFYRI